MTTLQRKILRIPGNPDYIYFHDGIQGKCYRRTGFQTLSAGVDITTDQITSDFTQHQSDPTAYPVVTYDSCETCQGIDTFYNVKLDQVTVSFDPGDQPVETYTPGDDLFNIDLLGAQVLVQLDTDRFQVALSGQNTSVIRREGIPGQNNAPPDDFTRVGELSAWGSYDNLDNWTVCV